MAPAIAWLLVLAFAGLPMLAAILFIYHLVSKAQSLSFVARRWERRIVVFSMGTSGAIAASSINQLQLLPSYHDVLEIVSGVCLVIVFLTLFAFFRTLGLFQWRYPWHH